jgi:hypothetical protein
MTLTPPEKKQITTTQDVPHKWWYTEAGKYPLLTLEEAAKAVLLHHQSLKTSEVSEKSSSQPGNPGEHGKMITAKVLYASLAELLATTSDKAYRTWNETAILFRAREVAKLYESQNGLTSVSSTLKPHDQRTYQDGKVELELEGQTTERVSVPEFVPSTASPASPPLQADPVVDYTVDFWRRDLTPSVTWQVP